MSPSKGHFTMTTTTAAILHIQRCGNRETLLADPLEGSQIARKSTRLAGRGMENKQEKDHEVNWLLLLSGETYLKSNPERKLGNYALELLACA